MRSLPVLLVLTVFSASAFAASTPHAAQSSGGANAAASQMANKGKVVSSLAAGMYTYIELSSGGKENTWIAVTSMPVKKGDTVAYDGGAPMTNFYSKSLNRTFPQVLFVSKASVVK